MADSIYTTLEQTQRIVAALAERVRNKGYAVEADLGALAKKDEVAKSDLATALAKIIDDVVAESSSNKSAIDILNGEAAGSVKKAIDDAFNDFASKVSDDNVVNTYKELIDYAAANGAQVTSLVGQISDLASKMTLGTYSDGGTQKEYATVKAYVEAYVTSQITSATLTNGNGISISGGSVSVKVDSSNANGLSAASSGLKLALASKTAAGAMSAADKEKLDGIRCATESELQAVINGITI